MIFFRKFIIRLQVVGVFLVPRIITQHECAEDRQRPPISESSFKLLHLSFRSPNIKSAIKRSPSVEKSHKCFLLLICSNRTIFSRAMFSMPYARGGLSSPIFKRRTFFLSELFKFGLFSWRPFSTIQGCQLLAPPRPLALKLLLLLFQLTHSDHRSFSCSVCKRKFKQLSQLKNHAVTHMDKEKDVVSNFDWFRAIKMALLLCTAISLS